MSIRRLGPALAAVVAAFPIAGGLPAEPASAANSLIIANRHDDGTGSSLRAALDTVNAEGGAWTIWLEPGPPYEVNRNCQNGDLDDNHGGDLDVLIAGKVTFASTTAELATIQVTCAGERVVDALGGGEVIFRKIRLTGGNTANGASGDQNGDRDGSSGGNGGAVRSTGTVRLFDSVVEGNSTGNGGNGAPVQFGSGPGGRGGDGGNGGAIKASTIHATRSTFAANTTGNGGKGANGVGAGHPGGDGGHGGNGALAAFDLFLTDVRISTNALGAGGKGGQGIAGPGGVGGAGGSGGALFGMFLELTDSTLDGNVAGVGGAGGTGTTQGGSGGDAGNGGAVHADMGLIHSSTIVGNVAGAPGAGGPGAVAGPSGDPSEGGAVRNVAGLALDIGFSTITANSAATGANLHVSAESALTASVIAEPLGGGDNCVVALASKGYNVSDNTACAQAATDITVAAAVLGPLADNGGYTPTRMPLPGGALISSIPADVCTALPAPNHEGWDQRGEPRPSGDCEPGAVEVPVASASRFVPLAPARVFDTREPGPSTGFIPAGGTRTVRFAGVAGVPAEGATAVAFNLTIDAAGDAGFVTASPTGAPFPLASNLNVERPGQTAPNFAVVPLGANGSIDFFVQSGGHLIADVIGYFTPSQVASAGRILSFVPQRLFDTREPGALNGKVPAGGTIVVPVDDRPPGVAAVIVNVTATEADDRGYITVFPGGTDRPLASTLNLDGPGHTAANLTIVPLGADGTIRLYSQSGAHLLADVVGFVSDETAGLSSEGLTVPLDPVRVFDTRTSGAPIGAGASIDVATAGTVGIPSDAVGVLANVTATEAVDAGYITGWPTDWLQPLASTLNLTHPGETRANGAILAIGHDGMVSYFSQSGTHLLADAFGYLLPGPLPLL